MVDQFTGLETIGQVTGHAGNQPHAPPGAGTHHDHRAAQPALELVDRLAQAVRVDAIDALGKIAPIPVLEADKLAPGEDYRVRMRSRLDIEALPAPLRPLAYVHPGWRLGSGWHRWELER